MLSSSCSPQDLLNSVQNFQFHYPRGNDARSVYLSWDPPLTPAGILGYTVYINDQQISTGLDRFYEFSASPDTVYTASVCYRGASPCYRPSVILFELSQDFVDSESSPHAYLYTVWALSYNMYTYMYVCSICCSCRVCKCMCYTSITCVLHADIHNKHVGMYTCVYA